MAGRDSSTSAGRRIERVVREFRDSVGPQARAIDVLRGTAETLLGAVPADFWCGVLLDPSTLLDTGGLYTCSFPDEVLPRLFEIEHVQHAGAANLRSIVRRKAPVSVLSESAGGRLEDDVYYRDILRPLGTGDEMRVLLRQSGHVWGLLVWCRSGRSGFSTTDTGLAAALASPAADALRGSLLLTGADDGTLPDAPGLVLLDADLGIVSTTPTAEQWLDELQEMHTAGSRLPNTVRVLATTALGPTITPGPLRSVAPTRAGRWVSLQAWPLPGPQVAVAVGAAGVEELVAVVLNVYELTPRERDVTHQILRGHSAAQIARTLSLSTYTVHDHLRSVYRKVGVNSARELMAAIFTRHYSPRLGPGRDMPPMSTDGRLHEDEQDARTAATA